MKNIIRAAMIACLISVALPASALTYLSGPVKLIASDQYPDYVTFQMTVGNATCPVYNWIVFQSGNLERQKAVYAAVLAAYLSGRPVQVAFESGAAGGFCVATEVRPWN